MFFSFVSKVFFSFFTVTTMPSGELGIKNSISVKGSAEIVSEFFYFGINSILYQRGIYPADYFKQSQKFGLTLLVTKDEDLNKFLTPLLEQIKTWLSSKQLRKLVMVITGVESKAVLERWQFDVQDETEDEAGDKENSAGKKDEKRIRSEIADVIRQITASVTFLPLLEEACSFDILLYTTKSTEAPEGWDDSEPCLIVSGGENVKLRSFSTSVHKVDTAVTYKNPDL